MVARGVHASPGGAKENGTIATGFLNHFWAFAHRITHMPTLVLFTQPGCFSCELMRVYLEAREIAFEERVIQLGGHG